MDKEKLKQAQQPLVFKCLHNNNHQDLIQPGIGHH